MRRFILLLFIGQLMVSQTALACHRRTYCGQTHYRVSTADYYVRIGNRANRDVVVVVNGQTRYLPSWSPPLQVTQALVAKVQVYKPWRGGYLYLGEYSYYTSNNFYSDIHASISGDRVILSYYLPSTNSLHYFAVVSREYWDSK